MKLILNLLHFISIIYCINAFKILLSYSLPVRSVNLLGEGFVRHLLNAGHEVTYITAYPLKDPPKKNFKQIDVSSTKEIFANDKNMLIEHIMDNPPSNAILYVQEVAYGSAEVAFNDINLRRFLEDTDENFDVVIADLLETELYAGLAAVYNCPMIWAYSMGAHTIALQLIDQPANPAYSYDYLTANVPPFTFTQRVEQLWAQIKWNFFKIFFTFPKEEALYNKYFGPLVEMRGRALPDYRELIYNASLIFGNDYHVSGNIPATPQNFKLIGGFHIEESVKPLPKNLQSLMDKAEHGVIYFSMGSTWKSKDIPAALKKDLLRLFGGLKQTVIWKHEEDLQNVPTNVYIVQWAPQQSILAHPKCLFFITHGGHLSSTEALHFGVPIIGVPVYFDQLININKAVMKGYALEVKLNHDLATNLKSAINEMLSNPKYKEKAAELSKVYHHRSIPPGEEMVHWVEHVIKTDGAPHLRSAALHMPFYQKIYLDLIALVVVVLVILLIVWEKVLKRDRVRGRKQKRN